MKKYQKTIFECDFCKKKYFIEGYAKKHEDICFYNPKNKTACLDCMTLRKKKAKIENDGDFYFGDYYEAPPTEVECFWCDTIESFLYPPSVAKKKNYFFFEDYENVEMPKKCKNQEKIK